MQEKRHAGEATCRRIGNILINLQGWSNLEGLSWGRMERACLAPAPLSKVQRYCGNNAAGDSLRGLPSPDVRHLAISCYAVKSNAWMKPFESN